MSGTLTAATPDVLTTAPESQVFAVDAAGRTIVGLVMLVCILGAAGLVALKIRAPVESGRAASTIPGSTTSGRHIGVTQASSVDACRSSYRAVQTAVDVYETETGAGPKTIGQLQPLLRDRIVSSLYTITIDRNLAGEIDVATPGHPALPGESNCAYAGQ